MTAHQQEPLPPAPWTLPPGYLWVRTLAERRGQCVGEAIRDGRRVALRLEHGSQARESLAELEVLAAIDHPGLARLVDHGSLPGEEGHYVAREWVEGHPLSELRAGRTPEDFGKLAIRLCWALEHLHARGFVHGDLKASNVILREDADPVLTDFGFAVRAGHAALEGSSGSLLGIAPELLLGAPSDQRCDLFSLGVMLHDLIAPIRVDAREFYGRFPAQSFFEAIAASKSELPAWARDLIERLVERDPNRRPASAAWLARILEGRLGVKRRGKVVVPRVELRWPLLHGKETFVEAELGARDAGAEERPSWWTLAPGEDALAFVEALALHLEFHAPARVGRVVRVDMSRALDRIEDVRSLDRWAHGLVAEAAGGVLLVAAAAINGWSGRALDYLARVVRHPPGGRAGIALPRLVVAASSAPPSDAWRRSDPPRVQEAEILAFLRSELDAPLDPRIEHLAARIHAESGGSTKHLQSLLDELAASGWLRWTREKPGLRAGSLPDWLGRSRGRERTRAGGPASDVERRILGALELAGGHASLARLARVLSFPDAAIGSALEALRAAGDLELRRAEDGILEARMFAHSATPAAIHLGEEELRELSRAEARVLAEEGSGPSRRLPLLYRADPTREVRAAITEAVTEHIDAGSVELALDLLLRVSETARSAGRELEPELSAALAHAFVLVGEAARAEGLLAALDSRVEPSVRARVALVRGTQASLSHDPERALEEYERATALGIDDRGELLLARARLLYESGRHEPLVALLADLSLDRERGLPPRIRVHLLSIRGMDAFRRGELAAARAHLGAAQDVAQASGDTHREASVHLNLGTIERRTGDLHAAALHFATAEALFEKAGVLVGVAQSRMLRGGLLRETGELHEASELLLSALQMRERLGDEVGAAAVRGMLGMAWLERGHVHAALEELESSARDLEGGARAGDARLLRALALEARARIGRFRDGDDRTHSSEGGDPRIDLALGRSAWLCGDPERAAEHLRRALDRARSLGRAAAEEEAAFLLHALGQGPRREWKQPEIARDARVVELLHSDEPSFDAAAARSLADELVRLGRDDRAARLLLALAARGTDSARRIEDAARAEERIAACAAGLSSDEREKLREHLLAIPDPSPKDLEPDSDSRTEDLEMDVLAVLDINHRLVEQKDLATLLGEIVESALRLTGAERGFLVLEEDGELVLDLALDSRRGDIDEPEIEFSRTIVRRALQERQPLRLSNASDDPLFGAAPSVTQLDLRSIVCHPFDVRPGLRGVIYLDHRLRTGAFGERADRLLALLADQAALAIRQMRQIEEIRRLNAELGRQVVVKDSDLLAARRALVRAGVAPPVGGLVGDSAAMRRVQDLLRRLGPSELSVLVCGASGTGKELAARALHELSPRKDKAFVSESCAAFPASLIESELFGHRKGAFTGAERDREGLFERADGGTLFLDEIGELPLELQAKLLRVLETREVRRIGDAEARKVDFRLLAATNRELTQEVEQGRFRPDLYYRLDAVRVEMPPLSERAEDIPALVDHFLRLEASRTGHRQAITPAVLERLSRRTWPGNVRELANEVARLCVLSGGDLVDPALVREPRETVAREGASGRVSTLADLERQAILDALERTSGDKSAAADLLGISRAKIYQRLKEWREDDPRAP